MHLILHFASLSLLIRGISSNPSPGLISFNLFRESGRKFLPRLRDEKSFDPNFARPKFARIAQLVEHTTDTGGVLGSNPSARTFFQK